MKAFKVYPFAVAAAGAQVFLAEGSYFRVKSCIGDVAVMFDDNAQLGPINVGQGFKVPEGYKRLTILDLSGSGNVGTIIVAGADFIDQQLSGIVSVVDGGKARTLSKASFTGYAYQAQVAAQNSLCQLWNPAASGKNLILSQLLLYSTTGASTYTIRSTNAALAALLGKASPKLIGDPTVPVSELRIATTGALGGTLLASLAAQASQVAQYKLTEPMVLPPGQGIYTVNQTVNADLVTTFEFYEESF